MAAAAVVAAAALAAHLMAAAALAMSPLHGCRLFVPLGMRVRFFSPSPGLASAWQLQASERAQCSSQRSMR